MFKGFNLCDLSPTQSFIDEYAPYGVTLNLSLARPVQRALGEFATSGGVLDGSGLERNWFPQVKSQIFLSHSHGNEKVSMALAGWIHQHFGLASFVDSGVWGYADELLETIDKEHCWNRASRTYIYEHRNRSTSYVHMMLSAALAKMINRTECLIFLSTTESLQWRDAVQRTQSPWIYSELTFASLVETRIPDRLTKQKTLNEALNFSEKQAGVVMDFEADLARLTPITPNVLALWSDKYTKIYRPLRGHPLDALYQTASGK